MVGRLAGAVVGLSVVALLARHLHTAGYGQYGIVLAYVGLLSAVADLGLFLLANRELALPGADQARLLGNLIGIRLISTVLILGAGAVATSLLPYPPVVRVGIAVTALAFLWMAITQLLVAVFQVRESMWPVVAGELLGRLVLLGTVLYGTTHGWGLIAFLTGHAAANAANLVLVLAAASRLVPVAPRFDFAVWRRILVETLPVAVWVALSFACYRIDTVILSVLQPATVVGLYSAAYKILEILTQFPALFVGLVLPALSAAVSSPERFRGLFQRAFEVVTLAALPVVTGGMILAEPIVRFVNGDEFALAAKYLRILLVAVGTLYLSMLSGYTVLAIRKLRVMVWGYLAVVTLGVVLYLVLIPEYGATGAAIGTVVTQIAIALVGYTLVIRTMRIRLRLGVVVRGVVAAAGLAAFLLLTPTLPLLVRIGLGAALYGVALLLLRAFSWSFVREVIALRGSAHDAAVEEFP